jgi:superfamily I DNA/RNA helicase
MTEPTIYVASAGTGKTTALMDELELALKKTTPNTVIYTTFTNAGATEASQRAMARFPEHNESMFRFFRTLHSIAYRSIPNRKMMSMGDYIELGKELGLYINAKRAMSSVDGTVGAEFSLGDKLLHLDSLKRLKRCSWEEIKTQQENSHFSAQDIETFSDNYRAFRKKQRVYDFTDQLELLLQQLQSGEWFQRITHLFVDEAQDLSNLQWAIIEEFSKLADKVIIAGDDKQAIYGFSGGEPNSLINRKGERRILETSYRLPKELLKFSETVAERIQKKQDYICISPNEGGEVSYVWGLSELDLSSGTWMILVRNRKFLEYFEYELDRLSINYTSASGNATVDPDLIECILQWNQMILGYPIEGRIIKMIYTKFLRGSGTVKRGFKAGIQFIEDDEGFTLQDLKNDHGLVADGPWSSVFALPEQTLETVKRLEASGELEEKPRIHLATIHGVKGKEADNVVVLPDMAPMTHKNFANNPDDEHRVFYVAVTRARSKLFLHQPITDMFYPL